MLTMQIARYTETDRGSSIGIIVREIVVSHRWHRYRLWSKQWHQANWGFYDTYIEYVYG